jgi:hypothetical protein
LSFDIVELLVVRSRIQLAGGASLPAAALGHPGPQSPHPMHFLEADD